MAQTEIMPRFRRLGADDVRSKIGPLDPVTVADEAAERALNAGFKELFPGDDVMGEEAASADPALLQRLQAPGRVWIIDPIDGTANYAAGLPLFGVMAALVEEDRVLAGFIYDPMGDDTRRGDRRRRRLDGGARTARAAVCTSPRRCRLRKWSARSPGVTLPSRCAAMC